MSPFEIEIQLLAILVAVACALPGVFLVLRRMALMSDAISHSILLGIVLAFFVVHDLNHPLLVVAAAATGVATVFLVEALHRTGRMKEDAAIAIVFPALFSVAVILISRYAASVHLDLDAVLLGEIGFAPFDRLELGGRDLGPRSLWLMGAILLLNAAFLATFYKELKVSTFDPVLAAALGFSPGLLHYAFMSVVSVTAVGAFDAVGSILVVALMIAPPAAAYLLSDRLPVVLALSALLAIAAALTGYWTARWIDSSIAGSMAGMAGLVFLLAFLFAPHRGLVVQVRRRSRQRLALAGATLVAHLFARESERSGAETGRLTRLPAEFQWDPALVRRAARWGELRGLLRGDGQGRLELTEEGRRFARSDPVGGEG